jgi:hypothetical protein
MIVKLLGIIDIIAAIFFWIFGFFGIIPSTIIIILAILILAKGIIFVALEHFASVLDVISAIIIFISLNFLLPKVVIILVVLFLLQKGIFSLL